MLTGDQTGQTLAHRVMIRRSLVSQPELGQDEAMILCLPDPGVQVHISYAPFPIALFWLDEQGRVVDKVLTEPRRRSYRSEQPARYFVEAHPSLLDLVQPGDRFHWRKELTGVC